MAVGEMGKKDENEKLQQKALKQVAFLFLTRKSVYVLTGHKSEAAKTK